MKIEKIKILEGWADGREREAAGTVEINGVEFCFELETEDGMTSIYINKKHNENSFVHNILNVNVCRTKNVKILSKNGKRSRRQKKPAELRFTLRSMRWVPKAVSMAMDPSRATSFCARPLRKTTFRPEARTFLC